MLNNIMRDKRLRDRLDDLKMLSLYDTESYESSGIFENKEGLLSCFKVPRKSRKVAPQPRSEEQEHVVAVTENTSRANPEDEVHPFIPDKHLELRELQEGEILVDLDKYIVLNVWIQSEKREIDPKRNWWTDPRIQCDLRYYWGEECLHFMRHQEKVGMQEIKTEEIPQEEIMNVDGVINRTNEAQDRFQQINRDYTVIHQKIGFVNWAIIEEVRRYPDNREELWYNMFNMWLNHTPRPPSKYSVPRVI